MKLFSVFFLVVATSLSAQFQKTTITNNFYAEGADFGDLNGDGINDIASGPFWWEGPDFTVKHQIREMKEGKHTPIKDGAHVPHKYSNAFFNWVRDVNKDGKNDILIAGLPGTPLYVYLNPGNNTDKWQEVALWDVVDNESPELIDMDGDGIEELICNYDGYFGYAKRNPAKPLEKWKFYKVSEKGSWHKYTHGIGAGDVNQDGRTDLLASHGWFEQPESIDPEKQWKLHEVKFSDQKKHTCAQIWVYDVDADGKNDVIASNCAHGYGLNWFKNNDNSSSFTKVPIMGNSPADNKYGVNFSQLHALSIQDMDNDGLKDIVTGKRYWAHGPKGDVEPMAPAVLYWFKLVRKKDGVTFVPKMIDNDSGVGTQVTVGDIDGDDKKDVIVGNKKGVFLLKNNLKNHSNMAYDPTKRWGDDGHKKIFNGKDLTGWEGDTKWFKVQNGAIVAGNANEKIPHNFFLATDKDYYNFDLRMQVKMDNDIKNNGGIQIRSSRIPNHHEMKGYQADVGMEYWGHIYDESRRRKFIGTPEPFSEVEKVLNRKGWNDYTIICKDNWIQTWINGNLVSNYKESDEEIAKIKGKIAVQIHGGKALEIFYKNIRIKELK
ncbi:MAG: DUF1080 domain-containing protein [Lentisphaeraceae bacterium]|nr:DUF1080 domain-containing protein [Lentisphaeraceae bacterium]